MGTRELIDVCAHDCATIACKSTWVGLLSAYLLTGFLRTPPSKAMGFSLTDSLKDNTFGHKDGISAKSLVPRIDERMMVAMKRRTEGGQKMMVYTWKPLW